MKTKEEFLEQFKILIQDYCGMVISSVHERQMEKYLEEKTSGADISYSDFYDLCISKPQEMIDLINAVVVNETYFFREEKQFEVLEKHLKNNFAGKRVSLWSAACSSGEEPYSLAALAVSCNTFPVVYATDIDTDALVQLKNGVYGNNSLRTDGKKYVPCLESFLNKGTGNSGQPFFAVKPELKEKIICGRANLLDLDSYPIIPTKEAFDVIFIRNVFIYFNRGTRNHILKALTERLKDGGILFFGIGEIGNINPQESNIPLIKKSENGVYYFQKGVEKKSEPFISLRQREENERKTRELLHLEDVKQKPESLELDLEKIREERKKETEKKEKDLSEKELWQKVSEYADTKNYEAARILIDNYSPKISSVYFKYYLKAFLCSVQGDEKNALVFYEKAGISNPRFWPAFYQTGVLLQNKTEGLDVRKRVQAFMKVTSIIEEDENSGEQFSWLMGNFSARYFYQLSNEYLKKEWK